MSLFCPASVPIIARPVPEAESSPSPRTKKRGLFKWRGAKSKDDVLAADAPLPSSSISSSLAQEVAHKAKSLPRDNLKHLEKHQDQHAFDASDANGHVYDGHDREPDIDTPEIPSRVYLSDDAEDDTPEIPPREYNWSDLESDGDDDDDDDAGENEVMIQKVYDSLAKFGGPSKETEKLYDTLEQYQKVILARKQSVQQQSSGGVRVHTHTHTQIPAHNCIHIHVCMWPLGSYEDKLIILNCADHNSKV